MVCDVVVVGAVRDAACVVVSCVVVVVVVCVFVDDVDEPEQPTINVSILIPNSFFINIMDNVIVHL